MIVEHNTRIRTPEEGEQVIVSGVHRLVASQTVEAFWNSVSHFPMTSIGMNCALGPELMRPHVEELARVSSAFISCHPNAGLPNEMGQYDLDPVSMAKIVAVNASWREREA